MQIGFYFDQQRCTGCYACTVACRDWHDVSDTSVIWRRVVAHESGIYPVLQLSYMSISCLHCADPPCAEACPADAIYKREQDGVVLVDRSACLGKDSCGRFCSDACPYDIPQFGSEPDAKMQKCTLCVERLENGQKPVCVEACPMRALDAGPVEDLVRKYGCGRDAPGFFFSADAGPSLIIRPRYPASGGCVRGSTNSISSPPVSSGSK